MQRMWDERGKEREGGEGRKKVGARREGVLRDGNDTVALNVTEKDGRRER